MKRILLFLATNLAIMLLLGIVLNLLGINSILDAQGSNLDLGKLLVMSAVIGFTGSLFSLAISKWSAKRMMGVRVISQPANATESWLVGAVQRQAQAAGIGEAHQASAGQKVVGQHHGNPFPDLVRHSFRACIRLDARRG